MEHILNPKSAFPHAANPNTETNLQPGCPPLGNVDLDTKREKRTNAYICSHFSHRPEPPADWSDHPKPLCFFLRSSILTCSLLCCHIFISSASSINVGVQCCQCVIPFLLQAPVAAFALALLLLLLYQAFDTCHLSSMQLPWRPYWTWW